MKKWTQFKEAEDPTMSNAGEIRDRKRRPEKPVLDKQPGGDIDPDDRDEERKSAAEQGAEGTIDKEATIKVHVFRYVGSDGDGLVMSKKRSEKKMQSERWQYLGEFKMPGGFVNQIPRNEDDTEWRIVHKN